MTHERRNDPEIMKSRVAIACRTIQLGSISSLRCQKSRNLLSIQTSRKRSDVSRTIVGTRSVDDQTIWWSQTGSNRRPHACKARALPAELWPRNQKTKRLSKSGVALWAMPDTLRMPSCVAVPREAIGEAWWAWEDLNFRPHAYQARALTN